MNETTKWIISVLVMVTLPIWILPMGLIIIIEAGARSFKEEVLD